MSGPLGFLRCLLFLLVFTLVFLVASVGVLIGTHRILPSGRFFEVDVQRCKR